LSSNKNFINVKIKGKEKHEGTYQTHDKIFIACNIDKLYLLLNKYMDVKY